MAGQATQKCHLGHVSATLHVPGNLLYVHRVSTHVECQCFRGEGLSRHITVSMSALFQKWNVLKHSEVTNPKLFWAVSCFRSILKTCLQLIDNQFFVDVSSIFVARMTADRLRLSLTLWTCGVMLPWSQGVSCCLHVSFFYSCSMLFI